MQLRRVIVLAALVAGGCASILPSPASGGPPATLDSLLGEWSAVPFAVPDGLVGVMDRACREEPGMGLDSEFRIPLVHARGRGLVDVVYSNGTDLIACHLAVADVGAATVRDTTNIADALPIGADELMVLATTTTEAGAAGSKNVIGIAGASITRVRIVRPNREVVDAVLAGGAFAAWWPDDRGGTVQGMDAAGDVVAEVPA